MFPGPLGDSLAGRALEEGRWRLETIGLRDFATDRHRTVDDAPFGGGAGMVMRPDVVARAIDAARCSRGTPGPVPHAAWAPVDPGARGRRLPRGRARDPMRPLRRGRPTRHRGARVRRAVARRYRAVGRRARRHGPDRCLRPFAPGRGWRAGLAERGGASPATCWSTPTTPGRRCGRDARSRRCCCPGTTPGSAPGGRRRPSESRVRRPDLMGPRRNQGVEKSREPGPPWE